MILCDSGVIVATLNRRDEDYHRCKVLLGTIRTQLMTTWPCITETMYLLGERAGKEAQERLRRQIEMGIFRLHEATQADALRACALMREYADAPMDFADASLVVVAPLRNRAR